MEKSISKNSASEISTKELFSKILEKWYIIVATAVLFALAAVVYFNLFTTRLYKSTAKLYVYNTETVQTQSNEFAISTYLVRDYPELIMDHTVLQEVIDNLDLNMSYSSLKNSISIENPQNTRILEVTVNTPDAELSKKIADEVCNVSKDKIMELLGVSRVNIISKGLVSKRPNSPISTLTVFGFAVIGLAVSMTVITVIYITSDKIYTETDIEKYLNLSVLSTIPYSNSNPVKKKSVPSRRKKNGR